LSACTNGRTSALVYAKMRRVARGPVVILTCDPLRVRDFWLYEYAPMVLDVEARRYPPLERLALDLGGIVSVERISVPLDCANGFNEAYYGRPESFLEEGARLACSAWSFLDHDLEARYIAHLRRDLASGLWDARHGQERTHAAFDGSLVLVIAR